MRAPGFVDVDVIAVPVRRKELDAELGQDSVEPRVVRRYPLAAELVGLTADLRVPEPAADAIARLEDDDAPARGDNLRGCGETCHSSSDNHDIGFDQASVHASFPSAAAAAARPVRTAPSM